MQTSAAAAPQSNGRKLRIDDKTTVEVIGAKPAPKTTQLIATDKIKPSPFNARKDFPIEYITELGASIARDGQQEPAKVRPKDGGFELVFGECRWRACKTVGVPLECFVEEMTDARAEHLCLIENLKRRDLTVFEEAEKLKRLHEVHKVPIGDLAKQVGISVRGIFESLKLATLEPGVRALVLRETDPLPVSHAKLIARLRKDDQVELAKKVAATENSPTMTHQELEELIRTDYMIDLRHAPFDMKQKGLVCVAATCAECSKRSGNAKEEYPDLKSETLCMSPPDYRKKLTELIKAKATETGTKVLAATVVEKLFNRWGDFQAGAGFVKANDKHPTDAKGRTYRNLLSKEEVTKRLTLALTPKSELLELLDDTDLQGAIRKEGRFEKEKTEPVAAAQHLTKAAKEKREKDDGERAFRKRVANVAISNLIERVEKKGMKRQLLQMTAQRLLSDGDFYYGEPRGDEAAQDPPERRGWKTPDDAAAAIVKMKDPELLGLIFETSMGWSLGGVHDGYGDELKDSLKAYGLDLKKVETDEKQLVKDEAKAVTSMEKDLQTQMDAKAKKGGGK